MESSTPTRVLVVAHRTAATPALLHAVRERAARGPCAFTLLVPNVAHGLHRIVDAEDQSEDAAQSVLALALPLLEEAAGGHVEGMVGDPEPLNAVQDAVNLQRLRRDHRLDPAGAGVALAAPGPALQDRRPRPAGDDDHGHRALHDARLVTG